jgi:hypothetical protein
MSDDRDFAQQYLGEFATREMPLEDKLALYYHVRCEAFDRVLCSQRDPWGDARPVTTSQLAAINQNALEVRAQLLSAFPQVDRGRFALAIREYGERYTTEAMQAMLDRLNL